LGKAKAFPILISLSEASSGWLAILSITIANIIDRATNTVRFVLVMRRVIDSTQGVRAMSGNCRFHPCSIDGMDADHDGSPLGSFLL